MAFNTDCFLATAGLDRHYNYDNGILRTKDQLFSHDDSHWTHYVKNYSALNPTQAVQINQVTTKFMRLFNARFELPLYHEKDPVRLAAHWLVFHHYHEHNYALVTPARLREALVLRLRETDDRKKYYFAPNLESDLIRVFGPNYREVVDQAAQEIIDLIDQNSGPFR
ncbi:MAG: hypothetical protein R2827_16295 [Bdellovibrionales bacterium]